MKTPRLKRDWIGRDVRTLVPLSNGWMQMPAGIKCRVTYSRGGLTLRAEPCKHCGVSVRIGRVSEADVELL